MRLFSNRNLALWSLLCTTLIIALCPTWARAQVSAVDAGHLGLEVAWHSQLQLPKVGRGITTARLWVDDNTPRKYAVVELGDGRTIEVSADQRNDKGVPIGIEVAKQMAGERAARLLGKNDGFSVIESSIPNIRLVVATSDGLIQTFDAETGMLIWSSPCGQTTAPAQPVALSPNGVAMIQGRHFYLLDWATGKQLQRQELKYGSSIALTVCGKVAYVTDFRGRVEAYGLGINIKPWTAQISGHVVGQPESLADQSFCAFATSDGFVYTMLGGEKPGMWTRYQASAACTGSMAAANHAFYAGSTDGILAKVGVDDKVANVNWDFPTGEPITAPPLVVGNRVYVATESGRIHCIDDSTGGPLWSEVGLRVLQPMALADGKLYCTTISGNIIAVNAESGRLISSVLPNPLSGIVINQASDRLYVADSSGHLQCLRPPQSTLPRLVEPLKAKEGAPSQEEGTAAAEATTNTNAQDPFAMEGDSAAPSGGDANPFGGAAADPFGTATPADEGTSEEANPFAEDPFGSGK